MIQYQTYFVSLICLKVSIRSSRNVSAWKETPSICFTWPIAMVRAEADVKPAITELDMNPVSAPEKKEFNKVVNQWNVIVHFTKSIIQIDNLRISHNQTCQPLRSQKCILQLQKVYFSHRKCILQVSPKKTHIIQLLTQK